MLASLTFGKLWLLVVKDFQENKIVLKLEFFEPNKNIGIIGDT